MQLLHITTGFKEYEFVNCFVRDVEYKSDRMVHYDRSCLDTNQFQFLIRCQQDFYNELCRSYPELSK